MNQYKITHNDGTSFTCGPLNEENIKNLKMCDAVKSVTRIRNNERNK